MNLIIGLVFLAGFIFDIFLCMLFVVDFCKPIKYDTFNNIYGFLFTMVILCFSVGGFFGILQEILK